MVLIAPYVNLSDIKGKKAAAITEFGEPNVEREGVSGRRMAFAYPWTEEELQWIRDFIASLPLSVRSNVFLQESLPADWRHVI